MAAEWIVLPGTDAQEVAVALRRAADLLSNAGTINLPDQPRPTAVDGSGQISLPELAATGRAVVRPPIPIRRYRIGRRKGQWQYADVVVEEFDDPVISLDAIWKVLEPAIIAKTKRPRDTLRVALDRDKRFERLTDRDGVWWRHISAEPGGASKRR